MIIQSVVIQCDVLAGVNWEPFKHASSGQTGLCVADITTAQTLKDIQGSLCFLQTIAVRLLCKAQVYIGCVCPCRTKCQCKLAFCNTVNHFVLLSFDVCWNVISAYLPSFLSGLQDSQWWYWALWGQTRQHGLHGERSVADTQKKAFPNNTTESPKITPFLVNFII